ncbi:MAG: LemA family protein [Alphaproteobacteria bacterium]|nr:LemA family protein [Alphaproteobacteria bacterium]MDP6814623.1 LemA family protein [Alphaproteobacteria bacterium]
MNEIFWFVVIVGVAGYAWYVTLIRRRNLALEGLSLVDVQLKKRHDLLPNILKLTGGYLSHERPLFERITELRARAEQPYDSKDPRQVKGHLDAAGAMTGLLGNLFAVAENYPDLKADRVVTRAMDSLEEVEGHVAAARRTYNAAVTALNNAAQIFPGSMIAEKAGVEPMPYFEIEDPADKEPIDAADYLPQS